MFRSIPPNDGAIGLSIQSTNFIIVHQCDSAGILCEVIFQEADTPLASYRPLLKLEVDNNRLLLRRIGSDYQPQVRANSEHFFVIDDNLSNRDD